MSMFIKGLIIGGVGGLFIGSCFGFLVFALCVAAGRHRDEEEHEGNDM